MKKISIYILLLFCSLTSFGQITDVALKAQSNVIRNAGIAANTKDRIATMVDSLVSTKASRYVSRAFSSTLSFDNDFKMVTTQTGNITFSLGTGNLPDRNARVIINGNSANTCTFPANWVNGNGIIFDNTNKNKIYFEYDGTDVTYNIIKKDIADVTAPILSSPTASATGSTTATIVVTTNEATGTLYGVITTSATPPSTAQVELGQNNGGTTASYAGNQTVTTTGAKTFSATGLIASTVYYSYFMHKDASGNRSTVSAASSFTTSAGALASDDFNRANITEIAGTTTPVGGFTWTKVGSGTGTIGIVSNALKNTGITANLENDYILNVGRNVNFSLTVKTLPALLPNLSINFGFNSTNTRYFINCNLLLRKFVGGALSTVADIAGDMAAGDNIRIDLNNSTLTIYRTPIGGSESQIYTGVSDPAVSGTYVGIYGSADNSFEVDNLIVQ